MFELERIAFVIKPTVLMHEWIQNLPQDNSDLTLDDLQQDSTVLLLPAYDDDDDVWDYFEAIYADIFENELESWTTDEDKWPTERSLERFNEWFTVEQHNVVVDLAEPNDLATFEFDQSDKDHSPLVS